MNSILNFTIIQSELHWENRDANLQMFEKKIRSISGKTEVVLLPETFTTGFSMKPKELAETMDGEAVQWMKRMAAEKKVIIAGSIIIREEDQYYNRLIWMLPNGQYGIYNKRHRFAYAGEDKEFSPGNKRLIASVNGWKINLMVCYDLRFPVWARQADNQEYDVLVYIANWPERRSHAWKTLLQAYPTLVSTGSINIISTAPIQRLSIFTLEGKEIYVKYMAGSTGYTSVPLSGLKKGLYLMKLSGDGFSQTDKIIVE